METIKQKNRKAASERRKALRKNLSDAYGIGFMEQRDVEKKIGFSFPEALVAGIQGDTLVLGRDAADETHYELDVWAFALTKKLPEIRAVRFAIWLPAQLSEESILMEKWLRLLLWRLAFLRESDPGKQLTLEYVEELQGSPRAAVLPGWKAVLEEGSVLRPYPRGDLRSRGSKSKHGAEDQEQDRIIGIFRAAHRYPFKEFPISFKGLQLHDPRAFRIDILYRAGENCLGIIELKAGGNKDLNSLAQSLDYFIHLQQIAPNIGSDWLQEFNIKELRKVDCHILSEYEHPQMKNVCEQYNRYGFPVRLAARGTDGTYGGILKCS